MDRRSALKYIGVASAAAFVLPSCVADPKKVSIALNNLKINGDEEELLAQFATALIPATETPGAKEVGAHHFALVMVDDCMNKEEQEKYLRGMRAFDAEVKSKIGSSFLKAAKEERTAILNKLQGENDNLSEDVKYFHKVTRGYIIQGYLQSQHFLTNVKPYQLIPGPHFSGCAKVS
jgi:hypothetical protein